MCQLFGRQFQFHSTAKNDPIHISTATFNHSGIRAHHPFGLLAVPIPPLKLHSSTVCHRPTVVQVMCSYSTVKGTRARGYTHLDSLKSGDVIVHIPVSMGYNPAMLDAFKLPTRSEKCILGTPLTARKAKCRHYPSYLAHLATPYSICAAVRCPGNATNSTAILLILHLGVPAVKPAFPVGRTPAAMTYIYCLVVQTRAILQDTDMTLGKTAQ
jgi:hypothetical protein